MTEKEKQELADNCTPTEFRAMLNEALEKVFRLNGIVTRLSEERKKEFAGFGEEFNKVRNGDLRMPSWVVIDTIRMYAKSLSEEIAHDRV